jgi:hypothetical protein
VLIRLDPFRATFAGGPGCRAKDVRPLAGVELIVAAEDLETL